MRPDDRSHQAPITRLATRFRRLMPTSLFFQMMLIILLGLAIAQLLTFMAIRYERDNALRELMKIGIERDIASSIAILNRIDSHERKGWLDLLARRNHHFELGDDVQGQPPHTASAVDFARVIVQALGKREVLRIAQVADASGALQILVRLDDGASIVVHARRVDLPISAWLPWVLLVQLAVLGICAWIAVRLVTWPLAQLAAAADELGLDMKGRVLDEAGPAEVARAARAFNAMQRRIAGYVAERVEILAAISHDLQTPITRMRLRLELMDDEQDRVKFYQDLEAMHALVREGVAYARTFHGAPEPPTLVDMDALLEAVVTDYEDAGQLVQLQGRVGEVLVVRPHAMRRILTNLIDNALKFGGDARVEASRYAQRLEILVIDHGPGIPPDQLQAVLLPFYRVETSRNRNTGGTGLGLAIAQQLAVAMGAELVLRNRSEGGLEVSLSLPAGSTAPSCAVRR